MEISWKGKAETRKDFTHQRFEVRQKSEGMLGYTIWVAPTTFDILWLQIANQWITNEI